MTYDEACRQIKRGNILALRAALDKGLDPNCKNKYSWTLLMQAAIPGNTAIGELLISRGADLSIATSQGTNALSLAILGGHIPFINLLLSHGVDTEFLKNNPVEKWIKFGGLSQDKANKIINIFNSLHIN